MKKLFLMFFLASFFSVASFAATGVPSVKTELVKARPDEMPDRKICTVTVSYPNSTNTGTITITATTSCECTQQQACAAAYAVTTLYM